MATGSLVIRIGANLDDFSSKLRKATKDVTAAAGALAEVGKRMSLGITLPVIGATVALAKFGMDAEKTAKSLDRAFGASAGRVRATILELQQLVPSTASELESMMSQVKSLGTSMGMAAPKAVLYAENLNRLAASLAAAKGRDMGDVLQRLRGAATGELDGLTEIGIALSEAQLQQEAFRLGLIRNGQALTPLGKALASYSLLVKQTAGVQKDAAEGAKGTAAQLGFFKREAMELASGLGGMVLPTVRVFIAMGRALVATIRELPPWVKSSAMTVAGLAATIGPTIVVVARLTEGFIKLKAAMGLFMAGKELKDFLGLLKDPRVLIAMAAIAVAIGGALYLWQKFKKEIETTPEVKPLIDVSALMGGETAMFSNPLQDFTSRASMLTEAFELALQAGDPVVGLFDRIVALNEEALALYRAQGGALNEAANAARRVYMETGKIIGDVKIMSAPAGSAQQQRAVEEQARKLLSIGQVKQRAADQQTDSVNSVMIREEFVKLHPAVSAVRLASLELRESFVKASTDFSLARQKLVQGWSGGNAMQGMMAGAKSALAGFMSSLGPMAIAAMAVGKVLEGLQPVIDALFEPLVMLGRIVGIMLTPILKVLFVPLKMLGIVVAFLGEVMARVTGAIASGIGRLLIGIGNLLNKLPGSIGNPVKRAGEGLMSFARSQYEAADQLKQARKDLQRMRFGDTASSVDQLGDAARMASESLTNLPQAFKVALERWRATLPIGGETAPPVAPPPPPPGNPPRRPPRGGATNSVGAAALETLGAGDGASTVILQVDGRALASLVWRHVRTAAVRQFGSAVRVADVTTL